MREDAISRLMTYTPVSLETEATQWTFEAHNRLEELVDREDPGAEVVYLGAELRIRTTRGYVLAVFGQTPGHGKQGTHPARITFYRDQLRPVLFLAVQGTAGWGAWLGVQGAEPANFARINVEPGEAQRSGWPCADMIQWAFEERALRTGRYPRELFKLPEGPPVPDPSRALFA